MGEEDDDDYFERDKWDYNDHIKLTNETRERAIANRPPRKLKPGPKRKQKVLRRYRDERKKFSRMSSRDIKRELHRRAADAKWRNMTPEERKAECARAKITREARRKTCDHLKSAPRKRSITRGANKRKGDWYCPSCGAKVPPPSGKR